jgi:trehalose 6-phosphate phosphatase
MSLLLLDAIEEVSERIIQAPHLMLCLDFDGTLIPYADNPADVVVPPEVRRILVSLVKRPRTSLALVSGRGLSDLQGRIDISGAIYAGNHGMEISGDGIRFVEPTAVKCRPELQALAEDLSARLRGISGIIVEDKGLTLSVHYRRVEQSQEETVRRLVHDALARTSHPFHLTGGNKVFEIRPRVDWNKGTAVTWIEDRLDISEAEILYAGDDLTDEDAFAALPEGITIKVGACLATAAHYCVESPEEMQEFLARVDRLLGKRSLRGIPGQRLKSGEWFEQQAGH